MNPTVEILYITWNRLPYTQVSLPIVLDQGGDVDYRVVIVDNGSTDGTREFLKALDHPRISRVILNEQNLGISPVANAFWAQSTADYLGKVDNDIFLPDRWLEPIMLVHAANDPAIGVVGLTHFKRAEIDELDAGAIAHNIKTLGNGVQVFVQDHIGGACYAFPRRLYEAFGSTRQRNGDLRSGWPEMQREFYLGGHFPCYVYPWVTCVHMGDPARPDLPNIDPPESIDQSAERKRRHQVLLLADEPGRDWDARRGQTPSASTLRPKTHEPLPASSDPFVSVVLTSHNYASYLGHAIESVMAQTYQKFELIIVDDGSTDESPRIIDDYVRLYPTRIQVINHNESNGVSRSYNEALERVSGEILAGISSDDVWAPTAIETWVRFFEGHPDVDLVATDFEVIGPDGTVLKGPSRLEIVPQFERYFGADFENLYEELLRGNFLPDVGVATSMRRIKIEDVRYDELCPLVSDWELYLRLAKAFRWAYLPEPTVLYRWHGTNMSSRQKTLERKGDVLGQHVYVLGKELATAQTIEHRTMILKQLGRFWGDYTEVLLEAGVPNVAHLPGSAANELEHMGQRVIHLEEERANQQARAEGLEDQNMSLRARVTVLESANAQLQARRSDWRASLRRRPGGALFDHQGLFDPDWYLAAYPDVGTSDMDPFEHYVLFGAAEGRDPSPAFDTDFYVATYPDVAAAALNPLDHYIRFGRQEGRQPRDPNRPSA